MQLPEFDHSIAKWDRWRAFYLDHGRGGFVTPNYYGWSGGHQFTQFDTGELICTAHGGTKDRGKFKHLNLEIVLATKTDEIKDMVFSLPDGTAVPKAWFVAGTPLVIDWDVGRAYKLGHGIQRDTSVPERFKRAAQYRARMYWPGPGREPITDTRVTLSRPKVWTPEQREQLTEIKDAALTTCQLRGLPDWLGVTATRLGTPQADIWDEWSMFMPTRTNALKKYSDLTLREKYAIAHWGFKPERETFDVPYLNVVYQPD